MNKALESRIKNYQIVNDIIDLGSSNFWSTETCSLYQELTKLKLPDTDQSQILSRCYTKYSFDVSLNEQIHHVVYKVDSSD